MLGMTNPATCLSWYWMNCQMISGNTPIANDSAYKVAVFSTPVSVFTTDSTHTPIVARMGQLS